MQGIWRGGRKVGMRVLHILYQISSLYIEHFHFLYITFFCKKYFHKNDDVIYKVRNFLVRGKKCGRNCLSNVAQFSVLNGRINAAQYFMNQAPFHSTFHILVVDKSLHKVHLFWWEFLMEILILIWARSREKKTHIFNKH